MADPNSAYAKTRSAAALISDVYKQDWAGDEAKKKKKKPDAAPAKGDQASYEQQAIAIGKLEETGQIGPERARMLRKSLVAMYPK